MLSWEIIAEPKKILAKNKGRPKPIKISKILEPKTLLTDASISPFEALTKDIIASGTEVAAAITVKEIIKGDKPSISASLTEYEVRK